MRHQNYYPHHHPHPKSGFRHCPPPPPPEKFVIILRRQILDPKPLNPPSIDALIASCPSPHNDPFVFPQGDVAARIIFDRWADAMDALIFLWGRRLHGAHFLVPVLEKHCAPSRRQQLWNDEVARMKDLLAEHVDALLDGSEVRDCREKVRKVGDEIKKAKVILRQPQRMQKSFLLQEEKKRLEAELDLLHKRLEEFRVAMEGILQQIRGDDVGEDGEVLRIGCGSFNCARIHSRVLRECRRLRDGLPIYSHRRKILRTIKSSQVMVLIGETGSGKSTQVVQFLADSGQAAMGSIVCTQPRKIAAISLAQRIGEESIGCYADDFVVSYLSYSSSQAFNSKIIFMTDHCLLQHYMRAKNFDGISYIIVDEAHERSLNTDLLLALIKKELLLRFDLRLIIMSATADASKLADYFDGCCTVHVTGRNFPVDIKYVPDVTSNTSCSMMPSLTSGVCASYVSDVIKMVSIIHKAEEPGGAILAFLTSQMEVEWACENFKDPSAVVLPMHGKLSHEDQCRVMKIYQNKRKVIFATNVAETSLTIQGVKYVVDSGMVKDSRFDPTSGMNVLKVGRISQSSANQRAGRAGRTGPGKCYRLYSEFNFQSMKMHQEPEIRKVHLGIAVLRILALGLKNAEEFDFVDAPNQKAIEKAIENLINLGAVICKLDEFKLTSTGRSLVNLGIEPRLGKIILDCYGLGLKREGLVLAALMANYSSIFCRVGSDEDKYKSDCLKLPFCHNGGDLFTLLSVYKEWEDEDGSRNQWCWANSINAKSMRRCKDTVKELESCLQHEINTIIPTYWKWDPHKSTAIDCLLKKVILSSLIDNVAMYSGSDFTGYEVAATGEHLQLHPSCSLLVYEQKPSWVVFGEILSTTNQYMACVTAVDYNDVRNIQPPLFDVSLLESRKMQMNVITVLGDNLLKKFCGRSFCNLNSLQSIIRKEYMDERIRINPDFDRKEIQLFAMPKDLEKITCFITDILHCEKKWLRNECIEKCLFNGGQGTSSVALFGSGAEIKHLELDKQYLSVEIFHQDAHKLNEKELLKMVEQHAPGIAGFSKHAVFGQEGLESRVGKIIFLTPESAGNAVAKLNGVEFQGSLLKVLPVLSGDHKILPHSAVRARVSWQRRRSKGIAFIRCAEEDAEFIVRDCFSLVLGGRYVRCEVSSKWKNCLFVSNIPRDVSEKEIYEEVRSITGRKISLSDVTLLKEEATTTTTSTATYAEALKREIAPFMPMKHDRSQYFQVEVLNPGPHDHKFKASLTFDGNLHLEAAKALDHLQDKVLPGCQPWQKIECQHEFYSSLSCPPRIYDVIKEELKTLLESFRHRKGMHHCSLEKTRYGFFKVKICANATKTVADLRKPLEKLTRGKTISHPGLSPTILKCLLSRDGLRILHSVQTETGTYIFYDRQNLNVRIFGPPCAVANSEKKLVAELLLFHERKFHEIRLRGRNLPPDLMKQLVLRFGTDLLGLREKVPGGVELSIHTLRHIIRVRGTKEQKQQVEDIITGLAALSPGSESTPALNSSECPICLCELEDPFKLEACGHDFCRTCLVDQCESVSQSRDGFPLCCTKSGCNQPFLLADLKSLLPSEKLDELFRASVEAFVASSEGAYRFCPSPDCPGVYRVADQDLPDEAVEPFVCGACSAETCRKCHLEYHQFISCEKYKNYKDVPDSSLMEWRKGKGHVKDCPSCRHTIEKTEGCNHVECRCGTHICWVCLEFFRSSDECYAHLRAEEHI